MPRKKSLIVEPEEVPVEEPVALEGADTKMALAKRVIRQLRQQLESLENLLESDSSPADIATLTRTAEGSDLILPAFDERVIEGVFDGENMIGEDGKKYLVPPNYASKSKLVEGDLLRLVIDGRGRFIFKQRGPIERQRLMGNLLQDEQTQEWYVAAEGRKYRVLAAAVSYFKGEAQDEAVILVPKSEPSHWAAVENIIKAGAGRTDW